MRDRNEAHAISAPIDLEGKPASLDLNVDGLGEHSSLRCMVLDERHQPLLGFALDDCMAPAASGFQQRVHWRGGEKIASAGASASAFNLPASAPKTLRFTPCI